ncbi:hypothetical protein EV368DRAFT_66664 [Lentinula lateritia]|uniref:Uncharacterized protein n=1 Tax=Lentinula aff. lateritia TaxID=2804960 RepID=A0ACC1UBA4_9AGAR|nr:hypothetical protein F5876DRAFT_62356 [Lentinula aff. lateritia]KAJ3850359.1 hypothetical protein EV368DRAFT_66664 [Lentinula lateritia]
MFSVCGRPGLLDLPPEIWLLIGVHLLGDPTSLKKFAELNRHAFILINKILYQEVSRPNALHTLALSEDNRGQIAKAHHPAAFVKHLELDLAHPERYDRTKSLLFEEAFRGAFSNIIEHARMGRDGKTPALTTLKINCSATFLQLFEDIDFTPFSFEMISIECLPPPDSKECVDKCCGILSSLSATTPLEKPVLDFAVPGPPDDEADEVIVSTLNKTLSEIYFPRLSSFTIRIHWGLLDAVETLDITPFLRRHSLLVYLHCDMSTVDNGYSLIKGPLSSDDLPKLACYRGLLNDYLTLCADIRASRFWNLHFNHGEFLQADNEQRLIECLENEGKDLEALEFDGRSRMKRDRSFRWLDFALPITTFERIFKACTNLTRLSCNVNTESLQAGFIRLIARYLPNLETLTLNLVDTREQCPLV